MLGELPKPEEIVSKLRQVVLFQSQGKTAREVFMPTFTAHGRQCNPNQLQRPR
jgi:hypothetical protein